MFPLARVPLFFEPQPFWYMFWTHSNMRLRSSSLVILIGPGAVARHGLGSPHAKGGQLLVRKGRGARAT